MGHPELAAKFVDNEDRAHWHDKALWFVREKRDRMAKSVPEWESLRAFAKQIKTNTMQNLDVYLEEFEKNATANGIKVHWAKDDKEHNEIILKIIQSHNATKVVKSKSMLTEECHLNPHLEAQGIEVVDTDLGERIIQFRKEPPSHIVLPAIHLTKEDVSETFYEHIGTEKGNADPTYLTRAARAHLREKFLGAQIGITGVNYAIADSGAVVVCTNEGNADLGSTLPKVHIACMGIEKIIPRLKDMAVFTRLLARSATGQPITSYTTHFASPVEGGELHVVIVDNGRSPILGSDNYYQSLHCIRCGACMNTCPVFRRSGGFSYEATIPGPIGSTLEPSKNIAAHFTMPYACTLCASCTNVCPIKIDLHQQLYYHRQDIVEAGLLSPTKQRALNMAGWVFKHPKMLDFGGKMARTFVPFVPDFIMYSSLNVWGKYRKMMDFPKKSFKEMYVERKGSK